MKNSIDAMLMQKEHVRSGAADEALLNEAWEAAMSDPVLREEFEKRIAAAVQQANQSAPELSGEAEMKRRMEELMERLERCERREKVLAAGVAETFVDFVVYEINRIAGEGVDFEATLEAFVKANPQYLRPVRAAAWGYQQKGEAPAPRSGVEAAFASLNPNLKF